jgi:predicted GNAT superfamily acetyltransferase
MTAEALAPPRPAAPADFPAILALNEESVHFLSPLTPARLAHLHGESAYHRVIEAGGRVAAFLLALREGADYDSPNYRWFAARLPRFLYIDRVVVAGGHQGRGLGAALYADLFEFARATGAGRVTCEFDVDPPNEASRRFHARHGFVEIGAQAVAGGAKTVSLQAVELDG